MSRLAGALFVFAVSLMASTGAATGTAGAGWGAVCPTQQASFVSPTPPRRPTAAEYNRVPFAEGQMFANDQHLRDRWSSSRRPMALFARPKVTEEEMEERKEQLRVLLSASKGEIDEFARQNSRSLICSDVEKVHGPKLKLLQKKLGISEKAAGRLFLRTGTCRVLTLSLATLENKMDWLQTKLNLNKSQLRALMERDPIVLSYSIDDSLEPTIDNIQSSLKLSDKELTKMIARQPEVLNFNMSAENIKQRISLLQGLLDLQENDNTDLRMKIKRVPQVLFWQEKCMKESHQWIKQRLGLGDTRIAHMCRSRPELLYLNTTSLDNKADAMQLDLSLSDTEVSDLLSKYPAIFTFSIEENVRPKLQYLRTRFQLDDDGRTILKILPRGLP